MDNALADAVDATKRYQYNVTTVAFLTGYSREDAEALIVMVAREYDTTLDQAAIGIVREWLGAHATKDGTKMARSGVTSVR